MADSSHLLFALVLGVSMTAALFAGLVPLVSPRREGAGRFDRFASAAWLVALVAWLAGAVSLANNRSLRPWHVAVAFVVATALTQVAGPFARPLSALGRGPLALSVLRLVTLTRFIALRDGWLPSSYATASAALDALVAFAALALCFTGSERARRAWSAASLATLVGAYAAQLSTVRPLPPFEALYDGFLMPLFAVASVAAWRIRTEDAVKS